MYTTNYGFGVEIEAGFDDSVQKTIQALQEEGFGVLCDIDIRETLKKKLNLSFRQYRILGVCNPHLAHQALTLEEDLGLLLPCNVVVYEIGEHRSRIVAIDPVKTLGTIGNDSLVPIAKEVKSRLKSVMEAIEKIKVTV